MEGCGASDLIQESIELVKCVSGPAVSCWNYSGEDPRRDMRGFTVDQLSMDPDDAQFDLPTAVHRSRAQEHADQILSNGARLYNDHGHPEYSTPECRTLLDLVAHDKAGEQIVWNCALKRMDELYKPISIYKNNTDFHGSSYGTHECYLMRRDVPSEELIRSIIPFLVSRQIFAGAGKVGVEVDRGEPIFQLSARADYFSIEASVDTLHNRPIVNTRDEPHASPSKYRRFHVIIGDANMSEWATAMKAGTTSLVLQLMETGWRPLFHLKDPIKALKSISRDQSRRWLCTFTDGHELSAIDIQRRYLSEARTHFAGSSDETEWVLAEWESVLNDLERGPEFVSDRVDWAAKLGLLEEYRRTEGTNWADPVMQSLDLAYHDIDPETGLYHGLLEAGAMRRLITDDAACKAINRAPEDTRAFLRGEFVRRFAPAVKAIGWNGVAFELDGETFVFDMNPLVEDNLLGYNKEFSAANTIEDIVRIIKQSPGNVN